MATTERKRVLLAELDDRMAISLLVRLYEHNRSHDILLSRTADVTNALAQLERFSAVVVRAHPSKPSDLEQLRARLQGATSTRLIALLDADTADTGALYAAGADSILRATSSVKQLADEILLASNLNTLLEGSLEQLGAPELIQILCLCRRSLMLRIESGHGNAVVWLQKGEIHHAVCGSMSGQNAMNLIVRADRGRFCAIAADQLPVRTIHQDWQHVLLEAARLGDEAVAHAATPPRPGNAGSNSKRPPPAKVSQVRRMGKTYGELTELGLESIKKGEFSKAREYWDAAREIGPEDEADSGSKTARSSG
jgi:hypothetical protein